MAAKRNLRGYLRQYGYEDLTGISITAKQGTRYNHLYDDLIQSGKIPTLFSRGTDGEWLVTMRMTDFMEMYRTWEGETDGRS